MTVRQAVIVGRFQPPHDGHMKDVLIPAYEQNDHVLILLGSANRAPSPKNPFDPQTRFDLICAALEDSGCPVAPGGIPKVQYRELSDFNYSNDMWMEQVQRLVTEYQQSLSTVYGEDVHITLYGSDKDASSYYIRLFPQWELHLGNPNRVGHYSATRVRESMYAGTDQWHSLVPPSVQAMLEEWMKTEHFDWCRKEFNFYGKYRKPYEEFSAQVKHGYIAVTVDPIVFNRGRILLVKRRKHPGKGLWALPGGYLMDDESPYDGAVRECREETKFKPSRGWMFHEQIYANPGRSLKGRVLTIGFGFNVPWHVEDDPISHAMAVSGIEAGSDAAHAQWVPINDVLTKAEFKRGMFEDHIDMIADMYRRLP